MAFVQLAEASCQPGMLLRLLQHDDRGERGIMHVLRRLDWIGTASAAGCPQPVDGAVARDRHQPSNRTVAARVEASGLAPPRNVDLLQHVLGLASVIQYTNTDAKKLRRSVVVDDAEGGTVTAGDAHERGGKLAAGGVCAHAGPLAHPRAIVIPFCGESRIAKKRLISTTCAERCKKVEPRLLRRGSSIAHRSFNHHSIFGMTCMRRINAD